MQQRTSKVPEEPCLKDGVASTGLLSPFSLLPPELIQKIFGELSAKSIRNCRLVSTVWCDLIDRDQEFSVVFNDTRHDYNYFPSWKIVKCFIGGYVSEKFEFPLHYPNLLRSLAIWGDITPRNFIKIVSQAALNLEDLHLANSALSTVSADNNTLSLWQLNGIPQRLNFYNLRKLTLFSGEKSSSLANNLVGIFRQNIPNLVKLKVTLGAQNMHPNSGYHSSEIDQEILVATTLAGFISSKKYLKTLHLVMVPFFSVSQERASTIKEQLNHSLNLDKKLSHIELHNCRLNVSPLYIHLLGRLFAAQRSLTDIRVEVPFSRQIPFQFLLVQESLQLSMCTLVSIKISGLAGAPNEREASRINFRMFNQARNLKRLVMKRICGESQFRRCIIENLNSLPASLEVLELDGFHCKCNELKMIGSDSTLNKLTCIRIMHAGLGDEFGIDGGTALALCLKESLDVIVIGPLRNHGETIREEDKEYALLRNTLDCVNFRVGYIVTFDFRRHRNEQRLLQGEKLESLVV